MKNKLPMKTVTNSGGKDKKKSNCINFIINLFQQEIIFYTGMLTDLFNYRLCFAPVDATAFRQAEKKNWFLADAI